MKGYTKNSQNECK